MGDSLVKQISGRTAIGAAAGGPAHLASLPAPSALKRFFAIADAWELSPLQQCRLLKIPSPQVLERYRLGQAPRLSAVQQERAALVANIHIRSLWRLLGQQGQRLGLGACAARRSRRSTGDSPLYFMLENGLPALREVARLLVRESEPR